MAWGARMSFRSMVFALGLTGGAALTAGCAEDEPELLPGPRGIGVVQVTANQGVSIGLSDGASPIEMDSRNARLLDGRTTLLRVWVDVADDFEPREILAKFRFEFPDGRVEVGEVTKLVEGPTRDQSLDTSINAVVPGDFIVAGMTWQVTLHEADESIPLVADGDRGIRLHGMAPEEPDDLGVLATDNEIRVRFVPINHDLGEDCPPTPEVMPQDLERLEHYLIQQNPVKRVTFEVREPALFQEEFNGGFGPLLQFLAELRYEDEAADDIYYYGLIDSCHNGASGINGQAIAVSDFPTRENAWQRVAVGRWDLIIDEPPEDEPDAEVDPPIVSGVTAETFVHEMGHIQGRPHVACNGTEGNPTDEYPFEGGALGTWGFGVNDWQLRHADVAHDYMTYCSNTWVSAFTWEKVWPYIEELSSWEQPGDDAATGTLLRAGGDLMLLGTIDGDGQSRWSVVRGDPGPTDATVEYFELVHDGIEYTLPARRLPIPDAPDGSVTVVAPLPGELEGATELGDLFHVEAGERRAIEPDQISTRLLRRAD